MHLQKNYLRLRNMIFKTLIYCKIDKIIIFCMILYLLIFLYKSQIKTIWNVFLF